MRKSIVFSCILELELVLVKFMHLFIVVECSRKRFSEKQAEQWWAENRARVYEQYNVRMVDKSSVGVGSVDLAH